MDGRIRPYRKADASAFIGLVRALARYEKLTPPGPAACRRLVRDAGKRFQVLIASADGRPAGYAIWFLTYSSFLANPTLFLEDLFVRPEFRRLGLGRKLYAALRREAKRRSCGRMEWIVLSWNRPALEFYRGVGARPLAGWVPFRVTL